MSNDQRGAAAEREAPRESFGDIVRTIVYALLIALVFRTFIFQPFWIPTGSMKSTLLIGDYLFISKYSYGYSKFSLPFGGNLGDDTFGGRWLSAEPERGDVIVFKHPRETDKDFIKRLIGLPGDTVQVRSGLLYVNGDPVAVERIDDFVEPVLRGRNQPCIERRSGSGDCVKSSYIETFPEGESHVILDGDANLDPDDNTPIFTVPEGHYFFMGDNRDNSQDSRASLGFVPAQNLLGRAEIIFMSSEGAFWEFWNWRMDRFFKAID